MIDLTPLDVRNKRGDFKKLMRGYDPQEVDVFLELAAERLEALVRENLQLRERTQTLQSQVSAQSGREQAVQDALVTAQELRADIRAQSQREADHMIKEAEAEARRLIAEAEAEVRTMIGEAEAEVRGRLRDIERRLEQAGDTIQELERRRVRFLKEYRGLLEREMDVVEVEEGRVPFEDRAIDLELGAGRGAAARASAKKQTTVGVAAAAPGTPSDSAEASEGELRTSETPASSPAPPADHAASVDSPYEAPAAEARPEAQAGEGLGAAPVAEARAPDSAAPVAGAHAPDDPPEAPVAEAPVLEAPVAEALEATAAAVGSDRGGAGGEPGGAAAPRSDAEPSAEADAPIEVQAPPLRPSAPPPEVGDEPSSLELELMAGAESARGDHLAPGRFEGVPDLETVLAEAGIDEVSPPVREEISPPPATQPPPPSRREDPLILFDPDDKDRKR